MPDLNISITYVNKTASYPVYLGTGLTKGIAFHLKG